MLKGAFVSFPAPTAPSLYLDDKLGVVAVFLRSIAQRKAELHESPCLDAHLTKDKEFTRCVN